MTSSNPSFTKIFATSILLFCVSLFLSAYSAKNQSVARVGTALITELVSPLQSANSNVQGWFFEVWDGYVNLIDTKKENALLTLKLKNLEAENAKLQELAEENSRLSGILNVVEKEHYQGITASVIGYDASNWVRTITIDRGLGSNIEVGNAVVEGQGLVGQVIAVSLHTAKVLLIIDPTSGIDALVQSSRARGVVAGTGMNSCDLKFVLDEDQVQIGDRVLTSGMGGVFPKGVIVGTVSLVDQQSTKMFKTIELQPKVDFFKLETVFVITNYPKD